MISRKEHWHLALSNYFDEVAFNRFEFGKFDCCLFIAGAVQAMTGVDIAADYRGKYADAASAAEALKTIGAGSLAKSLTALFGKPRHVAHAKRGDIVLFHDRGDEIGAVGICCGTFSRFIGSIDEAGGVIPADGDEPAQGLIPIPTRMCSLTWAVPF
jgi:cell wall-associated NlpC family hydrolase